MIPPTLGISTFAHLIIISAFKAKNFLGFKEREKEIEKKKNILNRIFISFMIAAIIESVFFFVITSSVLVLGAGVMSSRSNFNIIKSAFDTLEKKDVYACSTETNCYFEGSPPDTFIPVSWNKINNIKTIKHETGI